MDRSPYDPFSDDESISKEEGIDNFKSVAPPEAIPTLIKRSTPRYGPNERYRTDEELKLFGDYNYSTVQPGPKRRRKAVKGALKKGGARQRNAPTSQIAEGKPISRSYEDCCEEDKKLIQLRDSGMTWPEVRRAYAAFTGQEEMGTSTLPNRYARLKANLSPLEAEDDPLLLQCKLEVDRSFEKNRWQYVAEMMVKKGAQMYNPSDLATRYKNLLFKAENFYNKDDDSSAAEGDVEEEGSE